MVEKRPGHSDDRLDDTAILNSEEGGTWRRGKPSTLKYRDSLKRDLEN